MKKLICSTFREGYGIDQIRRTMTAGELINFLAQYDEDTPVYLSFDNGYLAICSGVSVSMPTSWHSEMMPSRKTLISFVEYSLVPLIAR